MKNKLIECTELTSKQLIKAPLTEAEENGDYVGHWVAPIWRLDERNLNGRTYSTELANRIVSEAKVTGVCDSHDPDWHKDYGNYVAAAKNPRIENGCLVVDVYTVDEAFEQKLNRLFSLGVGIGVSSVGYGETDEHGVVKPESYELIRYLDFVTYPAGEVYATPETEEKESAKEAGSAMITALQYLNASLEAKHD